MEYSGPRSSRLQRRLSQHGKLCRPIHSYAGAHLPAVGKPTAGRPVELEGAIGIGDEGAVVQERLGRSLSVAEVDKAVAGIVPGTH